MKKIRKNIFETNSSSSHVLTFDESEEGAVQRLPGNYLLKLTDEFANMSFEPEYILDSKDIGVQDPAQKLRYLYVYCAWYPKLYKLFKKAVKRYAEQCDIVIDFDPEEEKHLYYYNIASDYLFDNDFVINHASMACLDGEFKNKSDEAIISTMIDIISDSRYAIINEPDDFE